MSDMRILSVGQCAMDTGSIARLVRGPVGAEAVAVDTAVEAMEKARAGGFALVLVNRVFDADGGSGLDLIRALKADAATAGLPVMLVSNYADAQAEAVAAGAVPGFGKAALGQPDTAARIKALLQG